MGRRRLDQVFLPGTYVFPGGRVDPADKKVPFSTALNAGIAADLLSGMSGRASPERARALAFAAVRETFEETGYVVGTPLSAQAPVTAVAHAWSGFFACGYAPALEPLVYFARAITPPGRPRRYDTRFFAVRRSAVEGPLRTGDGELEDIGWRTLDEVRLLKLPSVTRLVLEDFVRLLSLSAAAAQGAGRSEGGGGGIATGIPFYFQRKGVFQRVLLSRAPHVPGA